MSDEIKTAAARYTDYINLDEEIAWAKLRKLQAEALIAEISLSRQLARMSKDDPTRELGAVIADVLNAQALYEQTHLYADGDVDGYVDKDHSDGV